MSIAVEETAEGLRPIVLRVPINDQVVLAEDVKIPGGIVDLESFRAWTRSDEFPERGRIEYANGAIHVDLSMEQAFWHNQVKTAFIFGIELLMMARRTGRFFGDDMRVFFPVAGLSTEPDGMFVSFDSVRDGRLRRISGQQGGVTEFVGRPEMVLEVVSDFSEVKDTVDRPALYFGEGVSEFWRVDARRDACRFELFIQGAEGYTPATQFDGWQRSLLFQRWFRLERALDEIGDPLFDLRVKE